MPEQKIQEPIAIGCFAIEEFQQLLEQSPDQVIIIDVRSPEEFAEKHIPGAINIPLSELESRSGELYQSEILFSPKWVIKNIAV